MPKYCSNGTVGVRQTEKAGSRDVKSEVIFIPDSAHTITHEGVRYAVFVSEGRKRAIIHKLKDKTGAVIEAEQTTFTVAPQAAVCGTLVALEVEFVNAKEAAETAAEAETAAKTAEMAAAEAETAAKTAETAAAEAETAAAEAETAANTKNRLRLVGITAPAP